MLSLYEAIIEEFKSRVKLQQQQGDIKIYCTSGNETAMGFCPKPLVEFLQLFVATVVILV